VDRREEIPFSCVPDRGGSHQILRWQGAL
jgi:hypothetical protein